MNATEKALRLCREVLGDLQLTAVLTAGERQQCMDARAACSVALKHEVSAISALREMLDHSAVVHANDFVELEVVKEYYEKAYSVLADKPAV